LDLDDDSAAIEGDNDDDEPQNWDVNVVETISDKSAKSSKSDKNKFPNGKKPSFDINKLRDDDEDLFDDDLL